MQKLSKICTIIFLRLLDKLGTYQGITLKAKGCFPIQFEAGEDVQTPQGTGKLYTLSFLMFQRFLIFKNPEISFILIDNRQSPDARPKEVSIYPGSVRFDRWDYTEESIPIKDNVVGAPNIPVQRCHCKFASQFLKSMVSDGFLR